jgi:hypothetical protein
MKRFLLLFLSAPTVLSTILPIVTAPAPTLAAETVSTKSKFCVNTHSRLICVKSSQLASSSVARSTLIAKAEVQAKNPDAFVNFNDEDHGAS